MQSSFVPAIQKQENAKNATMGVNFASQAQKMIA